MAGPVKWYAMVSYKEYPMQPPMMAIFVSATTNDPPFIPKGMKQLGQTRGSRKQAIEEAMDYLRIEMLVDDMDVLNARLKRDVAK